mmetsp:Transcript_10620/g.17846  ORF Transcript_10620/g.17846 Transcript_10620/m.17846 type:complete len:100 (-) Transcript_10620:325-624(-)
MTPSFMTRILSELMMEVSLCAMTMVVTSPSSTLMLSMASCTFSSFFLSRAEVASSNKRTRGFLTKALAMATLCFCPPESWPPAWPTMRSMPSFFWLMKS